MRNKVNRREFNILCGSAAIIGALTGATGVTAKGLSKADRVLVIKRERRLYLMRGDTVLKTYNVALGRYPKGHKLREGDARTPEGRYTLDFKLVESDFHRAIRISYPNVKDVQRAAARGVPPGGQIMIHGMPNGRVPRQVGHPSFDWTQGCIAVTNREIEEIWAAVEEGTPIEILP